MTITVAGILLDPLSQPMATTSVRVTTVRSDGAMPGTSGTVVTGLDGSYSFSLETGEYLIEFLQVDEYTVACMVQIDGATLSPLEITELTQI